MVEAASLPLWRREFPDFDSLPAVPAHWRDASWHNDACPFFIASPSLGVFIDYADATLREYPDTARFIVVAMESGQHTESAALLESDDWPSVLAFIADKEG
jgi:hypothetical protein